MKTVKQLFYFLFAVAVFASCNKVTYHKTAGGMPYQLYKGKGTQKIYAGNIVKYHVTLKVNDSLIYSSFGKLPAYIPVNQVGDPYDISEVWLKLKKGDSIIATQMMDTFIRRSPTTVNPRFKKGDRIVTTIKVIDIFQTDSAVTADEQKDKAKFLADEISVLEKYLASKNIKAEKTPSGAFVQITNPGTGNLIDSGKYVSVNYTGTTLDGKKFDSNTDSAFRHVGPYPFTVNAGQMIKGFDEAVRLMRQGATAMVYVPSLLAYGGSPDPRGSIKPFENLVFDIAVVDVKDSAPAIVPLRKQNAEIKVDMPQSHK